MVSEKVIATMLLHLWASWIHISSACNLIQCRPMIIDETEISRNIRVSTSEGGQSFNPWPGSSLKTLSQGLNFLEVWQLINIWIFWVALSLPWLGNSLFNITKVVPTTLRIMEHWYHSIKYWSHDWPNFVIQIQMIGMRGFLQFYGNERTLLRDCTSTHPFN